jgi:periplasmic protein TonB
MFDDVLIESAGKDKREGGWVTALISGALHILIIGAVVAAGYYVKKNPEVIQKPIQAFLAPAPPPPPPPPPAASSGASTPKVTPVETPKPKFHQPTETPRETPQTAETDTAHEQGGVVGGQKGGQAGGVVGGQLGGVVGGTLGGQLGGQIGGTGTALRVGGDVKAPVAINRIDPTYTEIARKARIEGFVIIEAIIDTNGNVTDVRILKTLPLGLGDAAMDAVRRWKFKPGTLNGQPVPVIYDLTVNFRMQ